jgi:hypothetical protein
MGTMDSMDTMDTMDSSVATDSTDATDPADAPLDARLISAWCVGGPAVPAYAFRNYDRAANCFQNVAAGSRDCRAFARLDRCWVFSWYDIGAIPPAQCICNPRIPPVGRW